MAPDALGGENTISTTQSETGRILPVTSNDGNQRLLIDWIENHDAYTLVSETGDGLTTDFDCLIVDKPSLPDLGQSLIERKSQEELVLPVVLLVEESKERQTRDELRREYPEVFDAINAIVTMPLAEYQFADRIETLLQMREQSREIATQREQLRAIRDEHAGHGVVITDRDGTIQYVNIAFEQQSGYTKEEVLGGNPRIIQSGEHSESFYEEMWETILSGEVWHGEVINERKNGEHYFLNQTIAPVTNSEGEIDRFIAVNHEITQLKVLETSLRHQREQLEILNRVLSHDIRNDLNVILGWTDVLESHVDDSGKEYFDRISQAGQHIVELTEIAGDLVADFTAGDDPDLEEITISRILKNEVAKRQETFDQATIEIEDTLPPETTVRANTMLSSVFRNLINNAIQHSDSAEPTVDIRTTERDDTVVIKIADNGPGIPDTQKEDIFSNRSKGLDSEGTGMGLFLVQSLIDTYDGAVRIRDNNPEGSIFIVELPLIESQSRTGDSNA